ncbi:hypothetical protein C9374_012663 [Naegleria lovaniensis]|uniref:F-box domain-containing protein n=1 Tax=Naegleria lovaniensis TaxID=51637 RepID=A0AA88H3S2_NAELO|nr:uncharacterized protein C9374_012663 [Naegleria lovaniensis]KAG2392411.1 hypothetical protein C9374_012663 [Naegleria lovaniensis]
MNNIPIDIVLHMTDLLILQPQDLVNLFQINHHWKEITDQNEIFWERQLAGLFCLILSSNNDSDNKTCGNERQNITKEFKKVDSFYRKFFFNRNEMRKLLSCNSMLKGLLFQKTQQRNDFLTIIDNNEKKLNSMNIQGENNICFVKKVVTSLISLIRQQIHTDIQKRLWKINNQHNDHSNHVWKALEQYEFFKRNEYFQNEKMIRFGSTIDLHTTYFSNYWNYLLSLKLDDDESKTKSHYLQQLFLDQSILPKKNVLHKIITLLKCTCNFISQFEEHERNLECRMITFQKAIEKLFLMLCGHFRKMSLSTRIEKFIELTIETIMQVEEFSDLYLFLWVLEEQRTCIHVNLLDNYTILLKFRESQQQRFNCSTERKLQIFSYISQYYYLDPNIAAAFCRLEDVTMKMSILFSYYSAPLALPYIIPEMKAIHCEENDNAVLDLLRLCHSVFLRHGKSTIKLLKNFLHEQQPFVSVVKRLYNNIPALERKLKFYYRMCSEYLPKDKILPFLKRAYLECWNNSLLSLDATKSLTELFIDVFDLKPSNCSVDRYGKDLAEYISQWQEFSVKDAILCYQMTNEEEYRLLHIKVHPIAHFLIMQRHWGNNYGKALQVIKDEYFKQFGNDKIHVPVLITNLQEDKQLVTDDRKVKLLLKIPFNSAKIKQLKIYVKEITLRELFQDMYYGDVGNLFNC